MKKKLLIIISSIFVFVFSLNAQQFTFKNKIYNVDSKVSNHLSKNELEKLINNDPSKLMRYNHYVNHSFSIIPNLPEGKKITLETIGLTVENDGSFDILKSGIEAKEKNTYYKFGEKYIIIYSQSSYSANYSNYIKSINK